MRRYEYTVFLMRIEDEGLHKLEHHDSAEALLEAHGVYWPGQKVSDKLHELGSFGSDATTTERQPA